MTKISGQGPAKICKVGEMFFEPTWRRETAAHESERRLNGVTRRRRSRRLRVIRSANGTRPSSSAECVNRSAALRARSATLLEEIAERLHHQAASGGPSP